MSKPVTNNTLGGAIIILGDGEHEIWSATTKRGNCVLVTNRRVIWDDKGAITQLHLEHIRNVIPERQGLVNKRYAVLITRTNGTWERTFMRDEEDQDKMIWAIQRGMASSGY